MKMSSINSSTHLTYENRINFGSFYTPQRYVDIVGQWLKAENIGSDAVIADITCGGGAFFALHDTFPNNQYIGNDIDQSALLTAEKYFPFVNLTCQNAFADVSRDKFGIPHSAKLIIVGNPPWNDTTSIINNSVKKDIFPIDSDIKTRDLGMSSILSYNKLQADYVAILHPLSYLIKQTNFKTTEEFFKNYELINHIIFNSQEFANTSKMTGFPVIAALYKRHEYYGLSYQDVKRMTFHTTDGKSFCLSKRDYIADYIDKYPNNKRYTPEILFYTQRDINALKRCRTFMTQRTNASVDVDPQKLPLYCYLDCFKRFADIPYYLGNFNVPFIKDTFDIIAKDVVAVSKYYNRSVFGENPNPTEKQITRIKNYISEVVSYR